MTTLILGESFNNPIDNLPLTLKYLELGKKFNQPIDNLPHSLTHLKISCSYKLPFTFLRRPYKIEYHEKQKKIYNNFRFN